MSSVAPPPPMSEAHRLRRKLLALGARAVEGPRHPSDLLGEAFQELRSAVACIQALQTELQHRDEALAGLRAELHVERKRRTGPSGAPPAADRPGDGEAPRLPRPGMGGAWAEVQSPHRRDLLDAPLATAPGQMEAALRARITGALCLGTLRGGDRLPGVREIARRTGLNHKSVRRVYGALERSGLVEVRDRSGIYVSEPDSPLGEDREEREGWMARILVEAAEHGFAADELPSLLRQWTATRPLRCACVESTEDDRFALCREISERFATECLPVDLASGELTASIQDADLVVTTPFHAAEVRAALAPGQPLVVVRLHAGFFEAVQRAVSAAPCALVCVDPASGERLRHGLDARLAAGVRVVSVEDLPRAEPLPERGAGIATLAAWERLAGGDPPLQLSVPPYLSRRAAHEIAGLLVRLNRAALSA